MRKLLYFLALLQCCCSAGHAQPYYFRHYQVEQGLSNNTVFCCAQDQRGFFWMGTKDGLDRFDGYSFKVFRNDPDDTTSIGDNFIRSLYIDINNNLYVGTRNGLYRYNPEKENFITLYRTNEEVRDIKKDSLGNIWLVAGQRLIAFSENSGTAHVFQPSEFFTATSVCIDEAGTVWVSTANGYLQQYDRSSNRFRSFNLFKQQPGAAPRWIENIYATKTGTILVGTSNYGVKLFHLEDHSYQDILTYNPDKTEIFARDFVQTSPTECWMATESGIFVYNFTTGSFTNLKKQYDNPYSVSDNAVYCLCKDREGGIWAGTYFGGVNYYPQQYASFTKYLPGTNAHSLSGNAVREICEDHAGHLWIGTEDGGLNQLDRNTGLFRHFKPTGNPQDISYPNIHGLLALEKELWIGTFEHGLDIMNIASGKVIRHFPNKNEAGVFRSNFIVVIYKSRSGTIYTGTRQGLYRYNSRKDSFDNIAAVPANCFVHTIYEDHNGMLWVGTLGNGLYYFDESGKHKGHFSYIAQNKKGLPSNSVTTLFESASQQLWIGTEGGGLSRFNAKDSSFNNYTMREGFPSNTIFKILEDSKQRLWITTSRGLVEFNPKNDSLSIYTTANGLLSNQFNYNSGYKDANGNMYFGSVKGMISFNPDSFVENKFVPPVYITGFSINDREVIPGSDESLLSNAISYTSRIQLPYNRSSFSLDFAALSFTAPEMTEYQYIMEGLDKDWTYLKTNRKVYFTNLSPGTYTFRVRAANSSHHWPDTTATLQIKILPPWWASSLAYVSYGLLAAGLIYYAFRSYHLGMVRKTERTIELMEHQKEKEIYQAKIDFFTNIAHEIKTPLTLIKAPMERIVKKVGEEPGISNNLRIMERNTDRLIELTNQLLDFRKVEAGNFRLNFSNINISDLLQERYSSFRPLADKKKIKLQLHLPSLPVMAYADLDSLQKIVNNLLYNALNYGHTWVEIRLLKPLHEGNSFTIEFSNDGNSIPESLKEKIFEPFYRLKHHDGKSGSGIGLALSRSLVDLHRGKIFLKETPDGINTFVLMLPIWQQHAENETAD